MLSGAARQLLLNHRWPGNFRELDNAIAFAAALCDDSVIEIRDLPDRLSQPATVHTGGSAGADLRAVLMNCKGNVSEAARRLGIDRTTLHRRMRRFGIERPH